MKTFLRLFAGMMLVVSLSLSGCMVMPAYGSYEYGYYQPRPRIRLNINIAPYRYYHPYYYQMYPRW